MSKWWLVGFTEVRGHFYIIENSHGGLIHVFEITHKPDLIVLDNISAMLNLKSHTTTIRADHKKYVLGVVDFFFKTMRGITSVEYSI